ncbi:MAG: STAS domain-containing protein, partial [Gemmataceae bacterium]|nr:STAS domain-containing protein [Gemmataceae bacterium]
LLPRTKMIPRRMRSPTRAPASPETMMMLKMRNQTRLSVVTGAALGKFITLNKKVNAAGGRLVLCNIDPQIYEVFEITKLNKLFNIQKEEQAALQAF